MNNEKNIENLVKNYDESFEKILNSIENFDDSKVKSMVILSLIDTLSQEVNNYNSNKSQRKSFVNFLLKYGNKDFNYLNKIDPVTLYYHLEDKNINSEFDLNFLGEDIEYSAEQVIKMFKIIKKPNRIYNLHTYASLIYQYRCKLMHEFASTTIKVRSNDNEETPMYIYTTEGWKLYFPYGFLKKLLLVCKKNYFDECVLKNTEPFKNKINYKYWYEDRKNK